MSKFLTTVISIGSLVAVTSSVLSLQTQPATSEPATSQPTGPQIEARADAIVKLWPTDPPATQPGDQESIQNRLNEFGESDRVIRGVVVPTLTVFRPQLQDAKRSAVIICPGGGYGGQVVDREGFFIAEAMNRVGITAFVLKYRLPYGRPPAEGVEPSPIVDVLRAIRMVRGRSGEWGIDSHRIGVIGFSAGGHLAGMAATHFDEGDPGSSDPIERESSRPDFAALIYPVASMRDDVVHKGSRRALIGENAGDALQHRFSTDEQISQRTPTLFVVHAKDDRVVRVENSERIAAAAAKNAVSCELHLYESGGHGFGLGRHAGVAGEWFDQLVNWLEQGRFHGDAGVTDTGGK